MKKLLVIVCSLVLCFTLCSCMKSEEAKRVDGLILDIGEVTLNSEEKIEKAERAVNALAEDDYNQLDNLEVLTGARETYTTLKVKELEEWIDKITTATGEEEKEKAIRNAKYHYNKADEEIKQKLSNYSILKTAEQEVSTGKIQDVIQLINEIGNVDITRESVVKEALNAYNSLSKKERDGVTNYNTLSEAMAKIKELKDQASAKQKAEAEQQVKQAFSKMKTSTDKVEGIEWYMPSVFPKYADTRSYVLPYVGQQGTNTWLRLRLNYTADDWIFFKQVIFSIDGINYYKSYDYNGVERDNDTEVWEYVDFMPTTEDIDMLKKIAISKETIVRFQGDQYYYDLTVKNSDKEAIGDVLTVYDALRNQ